MGEQEFYDRFYDAEAERIFGSPLYLRLLARHVQFLTRVTCGAAARRVLSLGCGDGRRELMMADRVQNMVGLDLSPIAIDSAQRAARRRGIANIDFRAGDATCLPADLGSFSAIWCPGVLHHLNQAAIAGAIAGAVALLEPGGVFVSIDPNARRFVNHLRFVFRERYRRYHSEGERELDPRKVRSHLLAAGLVSVELHYLDWFISPLAWALPRATAPVATWLDRADRLLLSRPSIATYASGFAVVGRKP